MPQLDTSTWLIMILSTLTTLFIIMQPKILKHSCPSTPEPRTNTISVRPAPWQTKWTKIYSPLSVPPQC
uniref:ATP synthase complex subunit 8 n=1 Tax=Macroderma gigas TaxID=9411 RepID=A0A897Z420_MACGG|nr:ATP synthase F0 subunit 8 [Macroderma gigas]QSH39846.1 ATP synthase F0 subunit 8 [Macroderma gigas]